MTRALACALPLALLAGCMQGHLRPMDPTSLLPRSPLPTTGSRQLEVGLDGNVVHRPGGGDVEAALGATLVETAAGLRVEDVRSDDAPFAPGDLVQAVRPHPPGRELAPITSATWTRALPVTGLDDLRGYGLAWSVLDLLVERGGRRVGVRREVGRPEPLAVRLWVPDLTRRLGFECCRVDALPADLVPTTARRGRGDVLVTYVAVESPLAIRGLRPLDVVRDVGTDPSALFDGEHDVVRADGTEVPGLDFTAAAAPTDLEALFVLLAVESDAVQTVVHLGPYGLIFSHQSKLAYDARTDRYAEATTFGLFATLFRRASLSGDGRRDWGATGFLLATGPPATRIEQSAQELRQPFRFWPSYAVLRRVRQLRAARAAQAEADGGD